MDKKTTYLTKMIAKKQLKFQKKFKKRLIKTTPLLTLSGLAYKTLIPTSDIFNDTDDQVIIEGITDDEKNVNHAVDGKVTVEDVIDDETFSNGDLSDDGEIEEVLIVPAVVQWD